MEVYVCYSYDSELEHVSICKVVDSQEKAQLWAEWSTDFGSPNMTYDYDLQKVV